MDRQSRLEAYRLDLEVIRDDFQLARQGYPLFLAGAQRVPQRIGESSHGVLRPLRVIHDERAHGIERIEQEMRIELRLQQPQLRLLQGSCELRLAQLRK